MLLQVFPYEDDGLTGSLYDCAVGDWVLCVCILYNVLRHII